MKEKDKKVLKRYEILMHISMILFTIFIIFLMFLPKQELSAQEQNNDVVNLAIPDLTGKYYLGNGWYELHNNSSSIIHYNVYNGCFKATNFGGSSTRINFGSFDVGETYIGQIWSFDNEPNEFHVSYGPTANVSQFAYLNTYNKGYNVGTNTATFNIGTLYIGGSYPFNDFYFKIQIEKGTTATYYQVPKEPLEYHIQVEKDNSYNDGFNDGLDETFNENNLMYLAEKRGKGTTGPSTEYVGFRIPLNIKVKSITLLNLKGYSLKDLLWSGGASIKQGFYIKYDSGSRYIRFEDSYNQYEEIMEFDLTNDGIVEYIDIILAISNSQMPVNELDNMLNHMKNNLGFFVNNKILNDDVIDRFKEIIEFELRETLQVEYQEQLDTLLEYYLEIEWQKGYDKATQDNSDLSFSGILFPIFSGFASLFAIELLPNVSIGAIILIPIVFGLVAFIIGRKRD